MGNQVSGLHRMPISGTRSGLFWKFGYLIGRFKELLRSYPDRLEDSDISCQLRARRPCDRFHRPHHSSHNPQYRTVEFVLFRFNIFRLQNKSLLRSTALALGSLLISFRLSGFPEVHISLWLILPFLLAAAATWDTARCLQKRWSFYHGGVLLLLYVDLMILLMISFLLLAPFSSYFF
jgi:hypothetical protein